MNLIIDVGNTLIKFGVFEKEVLLYKKSFIKEDFFKTLSRTNTLYPGINAAIVSSVGNFTGNELSELQKKYSVFILNHKASLPFVNLYSSPETLGVDRIALISAAAIKFEKENVLIIDAGSCITYDFLTSENEYLGGAISPGIKMRYSALNTFTENLPLLETKLPENPIGNSTENSIHLGVVKGVLNEIEGFISSYKSKYKDLTVILTGGDAHFLLDSLKNDTFANSDFLLEGLNYILEHNKG
jgi:type III pantothenate kinase